MTDSGFMGGYHANGRIEIKFDTERQDDGSYNYEFESAKLYTSTQAAEAAGMFTRLMSQQGKKVYEMDVPVLVKLETEGTVPGGRSYFGFTVNGPNSYQSDHWHEPANRAWQAMPWGPIDDVSRITGG